MDQELSTLKAGNRSTPLGVFWPIDGGWDNWHECMSDRQRYRLEPRPVMEVRPRECFVDERTGDFGPYIRWLIALRLIRKRAHPGQTWTQILLSDADRPRTTAREVFAPLLNLDDDELLTSFDKAFFQDNNAWRFAGRYMHGRLFDRIIQRLNAVCPDRPPLTRAQFLDVQNLRPGEVLEARTMAQFEHWLINGVHPPNDDLGTLMCEELLRSAAQPPGGRDDQLDQVVRILRSPANQQAVVNVYARNCWTGLRAFATALLEELVEHRGKGDPDAPLGLIYLRLSRSGQDADAPTPASVVGALRKAFSLPVESSEEGRSKPIDLHADIAPVARALTIYRTIIVVDGLSNSGGPMAELFDMMRNMNWPEFLRVLMQPHQPTLEQRGASYPSRLVVLSSDPVVQLQPWMAMPPSRLADIPQNVDARSLLMDSPARTARLKVLAVGLGARDSTETLDRLFPLDDEQREALFSGGREPHQLPTELDLALACLHSGRDLRAMRVLNETNGKVDIVAMRRIQLSRWMQSVAHKGGGFADLLAIKFVCASINGMRISTLKRCLHLWIELVGNAMTAEQAHDVRDFLSLGGTEGLVTRHAQLLVLNKDEDVEAIGLRQRRFELQAFPDSDDTPSTAEDDRPLIDVRLESIRELMFAEMIGHAPEYDGQMTLNPLLVARGEWELINLVLAEESLRQAITKLRNLEGHEFRTPAVYRRLVQCVYHGLLSHSYENRSANGSNRAQPTLPGFTLPAEPFRRFRYLYAFVFRHCIENVPQWTLSRGFVRSEMRFALMGMFANPSWGVAVLSRLHRMSPEQRLLRGGRDLKGSRSSGRLAIADGNAWIAQDSVLQIDILEALSRSAHDTGRHGFVRSLVRFVQRRRAMVAQSSSSHPKHYPPVSYVPSSDLHEHLDHIAASLDALRSLASEASTLNPPGLKHDPVDHSFEKLLIDSRLARAHAHSAREMCVGWLTHHGLDCSVFEAIGSRCPSIDRLEETAGSPKADFESKVLMPLVDMVLRTNLSARDRVATADILSRLGESEASLADAAEDWHSALGAFLSAYGLLWVADRVRSFASGADDSVAWPRVSSQAMRCFIRVSLKIARILGTGSAPKSQAHRDSLEFYAHARRRLDVYTSHLFRLPRERLAILLLMASATRVWAEISHSPAADRRIDDLKASLGYLEQAEALLFKLGFPDTLACRFFFERSKTYRRLAEAGTGEPSRIYRGLQERDLSTLRRMCSGDPFWLQIVQRVNPARNVQSAIWFPSGALPAQGM